MIIRSIKYKFFSVTIIILCLTTSAYTQTNIEHTHIGFLNGLLDLGVVDFLGTEDLEKIYNIDFQGKGINDSIAYDMLYLYDEFADYHMILPSSDLLNSNISSDQYGFQFVMTSGKYDLNSYNGITSMTFKTDLDTILQTSGNSVFLIDDKRINYDYGLRRYETQDILVNIESSDLDFWELLSTSREARFRVQGYVITIEQNVKKQIKTILRIINYLKPQQEVLKEEKNNSYIIAWETELPRTPIKQVMPKNVINFEGSITVRFEVNPNGTIGLVKRVHEMEPMFEREILKALRGWRFEKLPNTINQKGQWGSITFYFEQK